MELANIDLKEIRIGLHSILAAIEFVLDPIVEPGHSSIQQTRIGSTVDQMQIWSRILKNAIHLAQAVEALPENRVPGLQSVDQLHAKLAKLLDQDRNLSFASEIAVLNVRATLLLADSLADSLAARIEVKL